MNLQEEITDLYINKFYSILKISKKLNISTKKITKLITEYGIKKDNRIKCPNYDLIGRKNGKILVKSYDHYENQIHYWLCICDCGKEVILSSSRLSGSNCAISCGCSRHPTGENNKLYQGNGLISGSYYSGIRITAEKRGLEFLVSIQYLWSLFEKQEKKCAITNLNLTMITDYRNLEKKRQTASLDRIDSSKGYVEGNVQWVHKEINRMKGCLSDQEFINWCKLVVQNKEKYGQ